MNERTIAVSLILGLGFYFLAHFVLRVASGAPLSFDEAEAYLWALSPDWGHGPQPPLYVWVQALFHAVFGAGLVSISLWKAVILFAIYATCFLFLRRWYGAAIAALATLVLFWIPELAWESQRTRTHNVLATLFAFLAFWQTARLTEKRSADQFALLGIIWGLGLLAKWNFALIPAATILAVVFGPDRRSLLGARAVLAPLAMLLVATPTAIWMLQNADVAFASTARLSMGNEGLIESLPGVAHSLYRASMSFALLPLLVIAGLALAARIWPNGGAAPQALPADQSLIFRCLAYLALIVVLLAVIGRSDGVIARWLLPLFVVAFPLVLARILERTRPLARRVFTAISLLLPALIFAGMVITLRENGPYGTWEFEPLAEALPATEATLIGDTTLIANFAMERPELRFADPEILLVQDCPAAGAITISGHPDGLELAERHLSSCGLEGADPHPFGDETERELYLIRFE